MTRFDFILGAAIIFFIYFAVKWTIKLTRGLFSMIREYGFFRVFGIIAFIIGLICGSIYTIGYIIREIEAGNGSNIFLNLVNIVMSIIGLTVLWKIWKATIKTGKLITSLFREYGILKVSGLALFGVGILAGTGYAIYLLLPAILATFAWLGTIALGIFVLYAFAFGETERNERDIEAQQNYDEWVIHDINKGNTL